MKVRIRRYPFGKEEFEVQISPKATLLELLNHIKENYDESLSFRSMCRAGICGTCAVRVNSKTVLACSTRLDGLGDTIEIEPLNGYRVIRDLVVDHEDIYSKLKRHRIWLEPFERSMPIKEGVNTVISRSHECILCGICDAVCPVLLVEPSFGGPLTLTRYYKLIYDPRNKEVEKKIEYLTKLNPQLCTHCMNCSYACPKRLMPEGLIKKEEEVLVERGLIQKPTGGLDFLNF